MLPETDIEEFKATYNTLLQTFRDLKDQQPIDEPKLKSITEQLSILLKENLDSSIRIKLLEAHLEGSTDNLLQKFKQDLNLKDQRVIALEQKLEDKQLQSQRKANQHQNITGNLRTKFDQKKNVLNQKRSEYDSLLADASNANNNENDRIQAQSLKKQKELLEARLRDIQMRMQSPQNIVQSSLANKLAEDISKIQKEIQQLNHQSSEIQQYLSGKIQRKNQAEDKIKLQFEPSINSQNKIYEDLQKRQKENEQILEKQEQSKKRIQELKYKKNNLVSELKNIQQLSKKLRQEEQKLQHTKKELVADKKDQKVSQQELQQQEKKLRQQQDDLLKSFNYIKKLNQKILQESENINNQLKELKKKQQAKASKKQIDKIKEEKIALSKQIQREKQRQNNLKELQKSYRSQAQLKELKQQHQNLRNQINSLMVLTKDNKKIKDEVSDLTQKINSIKLRQEQMVSRLKKQFKEVSTIVKDLQNEAKSINKQLNDENFKINAYSKAFPEHEEKKLQAKKIHKKQEQQKIKEKKQKQKEETLSKKVHVLSQQEEIENIFGTQTPSSSVSENKGVLNYSVYIVGGLLLLILWLIFSKY